MTRNVTLRMNEDLLAELRHKAVDEHMSLSAWIATVLEKTVLQSREMDATQARAIARLENGFHMGGKPLTREEIYDR